MQPHEIEAWALNIIDRVLKNQPVEDSRIELKTIWPEDAPKAARQIAGLANATGSSLILWLIGVDEKNGIRGVNHTELANWYPQIQSQFDGLAPRLTDINVPVGDKTVVALLFETDRKPFVVKNPDGGKIQFEVPWRENTSTKSARREDLVRLLSPMQILPNFEVIECRLNARIGGSATDEPNQQHILWTLELDLYAIPHDEKRVTIPFHYCKATFNIPGHAGLPHFDKITLSPLPFRQSFRHPVEFYSHTIIKSDTEVIIDGPGTIRLQSEIMTSLLEKEPVENAYISMSLRAVNSASVFTAKEKLHFYRSQEKNEDEVGKWCLHFVEPDHYFAKPDHF